MTNKQPVGRTTRRQITPEIDAVGTVGPKPGGEVLGADRVVGVPLRVPGRIRLDQPQHRKGKYPFGNSD